MRLSRASLDRLPDHIARPHYEPDQQACGIVHFGTGAFHRAHQAVYTDSAMNAGERDWRITGISLRSASVSHQLAPQDGLYTVTSKGDGAPQTRLIGAVAKVVVAPDDPEAVVAALASAQTRIVTFTITEKGYHQTAAGQLDLGAAEIAGELATGTPSTIYGFLARGLASRKASKRGGLTLLSCDNLADNGRKLERLLLAYLDRLDPALAQWTGAHCSFPCSMVDRIVPATTPADRDDLAQALGLRDEGAVFAEPFSQWVIEDRFAGARPKWEAHGAQLVSDVAPYETAKLRMLNGAHSALAYLGLAKGLALVSEAIADREIGPIIAKLMRDEAATSFAAAPGQDLARYAARLESRFANRALPHRLDQIAMDGSQKIPQRWLETLRFHQDHGHHCPAILEALAAWVVFVRGAHHGVDDPMAAALAELWTRAGEDGIVSALFGNGGTFAAHFVASAKTLSILQDRVSARLR